MAMAITITFYGLDAAGMNIFMDLDQSINICLSLYNNTAVLSQLLAFFGSRLYLLNYFITEAFLICPGVMEKVGWS